MTTPPTPQRIREADDLLRDARASFLVIRGQCHRVVRVANRPHELIAALRVIEREVARLTDGVERTRRLLGDGCSFDREDRAVDPRAVVYDAVDRFGGAAAERGIVLRVGASARSHPSDGAAFARSVDRLLEAAIVDAPGGGCLTVTVCASDAAGSPASPLRDRLSGAG